MTPAPFLVVRDLAYRVPGGRTLLHPSSFALGKGAILVIAGPNGAGKTTLLNLLCGAATATSGEVLVGGRSLKCLSAAERARTLAVVRQQELPDVRLTLADYVALGQIPIRCERSAEDLTQDLTRVLRLTDLSGLAGQRLGLLSGGERQRAHIARALAQNPSVLFLDEPTNHLDPDAKGRMLSLVTELGITVVMIVHDLVMIPEFASHVGLMQAGRLTRFGPVAKAFTPEAVRTTFGVDYLCFLHKGRRIPALDIRKTPVPL